MDDPALESGLHDQALDGIARINRFSRAAAALWPSLKPWRGARVLDLACGSGDVVHALRARAAEEGVDLRIEGCDRSPRAVELAGEGFFIRDVVDDFPAGYDVYLASLFLHHLNEEQAVALLRNMAGGRAFFVSDLRRTRLGYLMARWGARLLTRSPVVRNDAPLSVRNAFSIVEVEGLLARAGIDGATIRRQWPQRFLLSWER
ncbi:MAG: methyltransferase domain-containing protein [Planctomycetota bacterium]|jgi:SAM-dependent methyltransferase